MKQNYWLSLAALLLALPSAQSVAIVVPVVYVATLSIAGFLANGFIGIVGWMAIQGIMNKRAGGQKISFWFQLLTQGAKKLVLGLAAMGLAVWWFNPIETNGILLTALAGGILGFFLQAWADYRLIRLTKQEQKSRLWAEFVVFSVFIAVVCAGALFLSLETREIRFTGGALERYSISPSNSPAAQDSWAGVLPFANHANSISEQKASTNISNKTPNSAGAPPTEPGSAPTGPAPSQTEEPIPSNEQAGNPPALIWRLWVFQPENADDCVILTDTGSQAFKPLFSCYTIENGQTERIFCPVFIETNRSEIQGRGSCSTPIATAPLVDSHV